MVWIADTAISASELQEVADEMGVEAGANLIAFACFVAEKCAAHMDREGAAGNVASGDPIRAAFAPLWNGAPEPPAGGKVDGHNPERYIDFGRG